MRVAVWEPGDPRCDMCDNGIMPDWTFCAYCGERIHSAEERAVDDVPSPVPNTPLSCQIARDGSTLSD